MGTASISVVRRRQTCSLAAMRRTLDPSPIVKAMRCYCQYDEPPLRSDDGAALKRAGVLDELAIQSTGKTLDCGSGDAWVSGITAGTIDSNIM